jgi:methionine-rich copper-binding protein CopC
MARSGRLTLASLLGLGGFFAACLGDNPAPSDKVPPVVREVSPAGGATEVEVDVPIVATFSEEMDPATITASTFLVRKGETPVPGVVTYAATKATFRPIENLDYESEYQVTVTAGVRDAAGNALLADHNWSFTTRRRPDTTLPTIIATSPADNATGVAVNGAITATFSEPMDPATVNAVSFTLRQGGVLVAGTVAFAGVTAVFSPSAALVPNTVYLATVTTDAKDLGGNPLDLDRSWRFTTGAAPDTVPPAVVSVAPGDGAVGVSVATVLTATFSEAIDPTTLNSASFTLTGGGEVVLGEVRYTGTTATFTPASPLAHDTRYTATLTPAIRDLAGNPLPTAYTWSFSTAPPPDTTPPSVLSTVPAGAATLVPVTSAVTATFSEAMDPATLNAATFLLTYAAGGQTIAVAGRVAASGTTAIFSPSAALSHGTTYIATLTRGVKDLAGNSLLSTYSWSFVTSPAPDTVPPAVTSVSPSNNASGVPVNSTVSVTFSEPMSPGSISGATFLLHKGPTGVAGTVSYAGTTATFRPSSNLDFNTVYTATVTSGATDLSGNGLPSSYVWSFTTGPSADTTAPTVVSTSPANNANPVAVTSAVSVRFSEAMDPSTLTTATLLLTGGGNQVAGTVFAAGATAIFLPAANLAFATQYTATVTTGAADPAGNPLAMPFTWRFTTEPAPDTTPPLVTSTSPVSGALGVELTSTVSARFSEAMDPQSLTPTTFRLSRGAADVAGTVAYADLIATFRSADPLALLTSYTARVSTGAKDLRGNALPSDAIWTFTTRDGTWRGGAVLDDAAGTAAAPQISMNAAGEAIAVWRQEVGGVGRIFAGHYAPGLGWSQPRPIDLDTGRPSASPHVAVGTTGNAIAVWEQEDHMGQTQIWANRYVARTGWGSAERVDSAAGSGSRPQVAIDGLDSAMVVWSWANGVNRNIRANRHLPATGWGTAQTVDATWRFTGRAGTPSPCGSRPVTSVRPGSSWERAGPRPSRWRARPGWPLVPGSPPMRLGTPSPFGSRATASAPASSPLATWRGPDGDRPRPW